MQAEQSAIESYYDTWAEHYDQNARIQKSRAERLLDLLHGNIWLLPGKRWAEIGCRQGHTLALAAEKQLIEPAGQWGFDPSERMIALAKERYPRLADWTVANPLYLPLRNGEASGVLINGGWQWSARVGEEEDAFREARRILRSNSLLALAHPGPGSDELLREAVWETTRHNPAWVATDMPGNPLGSRSLQSLLALAEKSGFTVMHGEERYEPTMYANLALYLEEIEHTSRAAWLLHFHEKDWDKAWIEISERMAEKASDGFLRTLLGVYLLARAT